MLELTLYILCTINFEYLMFRILSCSPKSNIAMTRRGIKANKTTNLQTPPFKYALGRAAIAGGASMQNSHPLKCKNDKHVNFCIVSLISLLRHPTLIRFIDCVTDVIGFYS